MNKNKCIRIRGRLIEQGDIINQTEKYKYAEISVPLIEIARQIKDLDPKYSKLINKHFWELI